MGKSLGHSVPWPSGVTLSCSLSPAGSGLLPVTGNKSTCCSGARRWAHKCQSNSRCPPAAQPGTQWGSRTPALSSLWPASHQLPAGQARAPAQGRRSELRIKAFSAGPVNSASRQDFAATQQLSCFVPCHLHSAVCHNFLNLCLSTLSALCSLCSVECFHSIVSSQIFTFCLFSPWGAKGTLQEITLSLAQIPATLAPHCISSVCFQDGKEGPVTDPDRGSAFPGCWDRASQGPKAKVSQR